MVIKLYLHINISSILNIFNFFMWGKNILLLDFSHAGEELLVRDLEISVFYINVMSKLRKIQIQSWALG